MNYIHEVRDNLQFQFDITRQMLEYHFTSLSNEEYFWRPTPRSLHIHNKSGVWHADWPETESYEIGPSSIAWTMWHITYWWEMVFDYSFGNGRLEREHITCSGDVETAKNKILTLAMRWEECLVELPDEDLFSSNYTKWPFSDQPFHKLASWLNLELMKNAAEIGYVRFHFATAT